MRITRCLYASAHARASSLAWPSTPTPSPYEIFHIERTASTREVKQRYYELVKLYHPDKLDSKEPAEAMALANERFRKIVAANTLLLDANKRHAFDHYGLGWSRPGSGSTTGGIYRNGDGRIYAGHTMGSRFNRYNRRTTHEETGPWDGFYYSHGTSAHKGEDVRITSNANMIGFLVFLSAIGAVVQAYRLGRASAEINERAEKAHLITARDLAESRRLARDLDRDERRRLFLVQRSHDAALGRGSNAQDSASSVD
ncbi:DnaJ domain-containing protein [Protomyces lactucae-debilis]|uniref:DnaJ domain-containing protein n=1 Tax=Protomyces lactucae-debilis TaxID=2754530 RepID=A0A1Y2FNY3_PROLT|nr:DnaJ domain-containing protein [Protomyces lactucae-debilis]ORY85639.1 DnaJ domain-containing protein [Protomyces lactucae-debilis]